MSYKSILAASAIALAAIPGAAMAAPTTNLDGIIVPIDTIGHADGSVVVDLGAGVAQSGTPDLSVVSVFGRVQAIGESDGFGDIATGTTTWQADLLNNGKELTYQLMLDPTGSSIVQTSASTFDITIQNGSVTYYTDVFGDFDASDPASAGNGDLWLTASLLGPETFELDILNGSLTADASGLLFEVQPGGFDFNFDTNGFPGGADIFTFSLQANGGDFSIDGNGLIVGSTGGSTDTEFAAISEPATLGLLGLGLVGLGFAGRRRTA